jgi:hypothetical protein
MPQIYLLLLEWLLSLLLNALKLIYDIEEVKKIPGVTPPDSTSERGLSFGG